MRRGATAASRDTASGPVQGLLFTQRGQGALVPARGSGAASKRAGRGRDGQKGVPPRAPACKPDPAQGGGVRDPEGGARRYLRLPGPPTAGVSVWGGAAVFTTTAQLPCFLPAVVGASPWHPSASGCGWSLCLVCTGGGCPGLVGQVSENKGKDPRGCTSSLL